MTQKYGERKDGISKDKGQRRRGEGVHTAFQCIEQAINYQLNLCLRRVFPVGCGGNDLELGDDDDDGRRYSTKAGQARARATQEKHTEEGGGETGGRRGGGGRGGRCEILWEI